MKTTKKMLWTLAFGTASTCAMTGAAHAGPESIGMTGTMPALSTVEIQNAHVRDYTFATAPTDWRVQSGVWEMTNRWSCSPGWSWFGGRSEEVAAIWNKRKYSGDVSVQMYFAFKMGLAGTPAWNYHPSDVALSLCGDGQNLSSGYTFIVGADNNSHSILMKGDQKVAESSDASALLPKLTDSSLQGDLNQVHRRWWYIKVNKIGPRVECWLDNKLLFSYNDPKPLDMGQIALWTYNNGIMLSRVQVFYEKELPSRTPFTNAIIPNALPRKNAPVLTKAPEKTSPAAGKRVAQVASSKTVAAR